MIAHDGAGRFVSDLSPAERFWSKVHRAADGCWVWQAGLNRGGYGKFWHDGKTVAAYRLAYEMVVGPIPSDAWIDHLCRNRACVNPAHLEPVTPRENNLRGIGFAATNAAKDRCINGHPFTPENTYRRRDGRGRRQCRTCVRDAQRRYAARKGSAA